MFSTSVCFLVRLSLFLCFVSRFTHLSAAQSVSNLQLRDLTSPSQCSGPLVAADPDLPFGLLFASCTNGIVAINGTQVWTIVPSSVPGCPTPQGLQVHNGLLYSTCFVTGRVDPDTPTVVRVNFTNNAWAVSTVATYGQCAGAQSLEIDHSNDRVYVLCWPSIIAIDGTNVSPLVPYDMCHYPSAVSAAATTLGGDIFVGCATDPVSPSQPSRLLGVNPVTGNITVIVDFDERCQNPLVVVPNLETGTLYVACQGDATPRNVGSVVAVHGANVSTLLSDCYQPRSLAFDPVSGFIFLNCGISSVVTLHPSAPTATRTTLVQADRCENARSMQILSPPQVHSSASPNVAQSSFLLLLGCRNSDIVMLATGTISVSIPHLVGDDFDTEYLPRG